MKFFILSWLFMWPGLTYGQQSSNASTYESFYERQVAPGLLRAGDRSSLYLLVGGAAGVTGAHQKDDEVHDRWKNHQIWARDATRWGDDYGRYAIGALIALGQTYFDQENGLNHLRAIVANTVVTTTLKYTVRRERPDKSNHVSFPSGHTSDAFASAASLTYAYGWKAAVIAYPLATYIGLSRIADEAHWLSDVTAGAFIGIWMGRAFFYSRAEAPDSRQHVSWHLVPELQGDYGGLRLLADF